MIIEKWRWSHVRETFNKTFHENLFNFRAIKSHLRMVIKKIKNSLKRSVSSIKVCSINKNWNDRSHRKKIMINGIWRVWWRNDIVAESRGFFAVFFSLLNRQHVVYDGLYGTSSLQDVGLGKRVKLSDATCVGLYTYIRHIIHIFRHEYTTINMEHRIGLGRNEEKNKNTNSNARTKIPEAVQKSKNSTWQ